MRLGRTSIGMCVVWLLACDVLAASVASIGSPEEMAAEHRRLVASGAGALMPDIDEPYVEQNGAVSLPVSGAFPLLFRLGLEERVEHGVCVYPVSIRMDDASGDVCFYNASGNLFWTIESHFSPVQQAYLPLSNPWLRPSHVVGEWILVPEGSMEQYMEEPVPLPPLFLRSAALPEHSVTNLQFTGISVTSTSVWLSVAWPENTELPGNALDLFMKSSLLEPTWSWLRSIPIDDSDTNATVEVLGVDLPGFIALPHVHDGTCVATTNAFLELTTQEVVTNVSWSCSSTHVESSGFFLVANRQDSDGDGLTDAYEKLVSQSSSSVADSDGDGLSDYEEVMSYGSSPTAVDTDLDGLPDAIEISKGLNPANADSDSDGLDDRTELLETMTDPLDDDWDSDGLSDGEEILSCCTSPFATDTDGDGLSDYREARECFSNPLSIDTDGDGMDDGTEYSARNLGLRLQSVGDAEEDADGDALPNLLEFQVCRSLFTAASIYEAPHQHLICVHPLEYPLRERDEISQTLLVLGGHSENGARIRIPRSTQLGLVNTVRYLRYTSAPGISIGNHSLATGGRILVSDADDYAEFNVTASPACGGMSSILTLEDEDGNVCARTVLKVPQMTGASLRLSNTLHPTTIGRTNLVSGVLGAICTASDDKEYGRPRLVLAPTIAPDYGVGSGHRGLCYTDLVLGKASGATNATFSLNYYRWDSAYPGRHGFELPDGLTRIDAGIDFNFNGQLDADEIAVSCNVTVVPIRLTADTDRNGVVDEEDRVDKDTWTPGRGAYVALDKTELYAKPYRVVPDPPVSEIRVDALGTELPEGYSVKLHVPLPTDVRLFHVDFTNGVDIASYYATQGLAHVVSEDVRYNVYSPKPTTYASVSPEVTVQLRLLKGNTPVYEDEVKLKRPPIVIPWNTLPIRCLYTSWTDEHDHFPPTVAFSKQIRIRLDSFSTRARWVQDTVQACSFQVDSAAGWIPCGMDLGQDNSVGFVENLVYGKAVLRRGDLYYLPINNFGNGGNIEATPPLPGYPLGRLMIGEGHDPSTDSILSVLEGQGVQGPAIRLPVGWLVVGHVDEVCCFIDSRTVLVPSPWLAFNLVAEQVAAHGGNYTNTVVWGLDGTDYVHAMQSILFDKVVTNASWTTDLAQDATTITVQDGEYSLKDEIYCDGEILKIASITNHLNGLVSLHLDRGLYGSEARPHSRNSSLLWLSSVAKINTRYFGDNQEKMPRSYIADIKEMLGNEIPDISFVDVPVLYCENRFESDGKVKYIAGTPNAVNSVVDLPTVYMPDPGCDLFRNAVQVPGVVFIGGDLAWGSYHCLYGEIHCGSEAERVFPDDLVIWNHPVFSQWPQEKKSCTP